MGQHRTHKPSGHPCPACKVRLKPPCQSISHLFAEGAWDACWEEEGLGDCVSWLTWFLSVCVLCCAGLLSSSSRASLGGEEEEDVVGPNGEVRVVLPQVWSNHTAFHSYRV